MRLVSINVGTPATITFAGKTMETAIYKHPVKGSVRIGRLGVRGDKQADSRLHGGVDQAVHMLPIEHYMFWAQRFGQTMYGHGHFGENLTTSGLLEHELCIGDRLRVGEVLLQVTKPRTPCHKLEAVMGVRGFAALMGASRRTGCYLRVIQEGMADANGIFEFERRDPAGVTIQDAYTVMNGGKVDQALIERLASISGLTEELRKKVEALLPDQPNDQLPE